MSNLKYGSFTITCPKCGSFMICTKLPITEFNKVTSLLPVAVGGAIGFAIGGPVGGMMGISVGKIISGIVHDPRLNVYICVCPKCGYILPKPKLG